MVLPLYVENESGNLVQKEYAGTENKSETEKLLRKAMEDYEEKKFMAKITFILFRLYYSNLSDL